MNVANRWYAVQSMLYQKRFAVLLMQAEIANYNKAEYENSLKVYRDLQNTLDTAFDDGKSEGKLEGIQEIARKMKQEGIEFSMISKVTGLSLDEIEKQ